MMALKIIGSGSPCFAERARTWQAKGSALMPVCGATMPVLSGSGSHAALLPPEEEEDEEEEEEEQEEEEAEEDDDEEEASLHARSTHAAKRAIRILPA